MVAMLSRSTLWLALSAVIAGCGTADPPPVMRVGARLVSLRPAEDADDEPRHTTARFAVHRDQPGWLFRAGRTEVREREQDGRTALLLSGGVGPRRELEVMVPGHFDPAEANRLEVTLVVPDRRSLGAGLMRAGKHVCEGRTLTVEGAEGPRTFSLELGAPDSWEACDHLSFTVSGEGDPVELLALEVVWEPPVSSLPPLEAPELMEIEGHWLRVAGLSSRRPLEATLRVPPGAQLQVDYGLPFETRLAGSAAVGRVVLGTEDGTTRQHLLPFEYELQVVYKKMDRAALRDRLLESALSRVRDPKKRATMRRNVRKSYAKTDPTLFGEVDEQVEAKLEQMKQGPVMPEQGLIDDWLSVSFPLDDFVGKRVSLRLELVEENLAESVCAIAEPRLVVPSPNAPLVLLITSEAHRAEALSAADPEAGVQTPWLDLLAERGAVFANAWAPSTSSLGSHAALMTGVSPRDSGLVRDGQVLPEVAFTLAERFREEGYATVASVSSMLLAPDVSGLGQGFDRVLAPLAPERDAESTVAQLIGALEELRGVPVFAWVHVCEGKAPYSPPERFRREYYPEDANPYADDHPRSDLVPAWAEDVRDVEYVRALYLSELTWLDRELQRLIEHPRVKRGIVAFAGAYGESPTSFGHDQLEPATLVVPIVLAGGVLPSGARVERPVQLADLGLTLIRLAGMEGAGFPGNTLLAREDEERPRFALGDGGREASVAQGGQLLVMRLEGPNRHGAKLYDYGTSGIRGGDVLAEQPERARELRAMLVEWLLAAEQPELAPDPVCRDERGLRRLEALGFDAEDRRPHAGPWIQRDCDCPACAALDAAPE